MPRRRVRRFVVATTALLIALGVLSGIARTFHPLTLGERAEVVRASLWRSLDIPAPPSRAERVREIEARYATHTAWIVAHSALGSIFLLLAALQFVPRIRTRHVRLHKINGTILIVLGTIITASGFYFGVLHPAAGNPERIVILLAGIAFLFAMTRGVRAIRRDDRRSHREWMIRAFAVAVGIATIRIVAFIADATLTRQGWSLEAVFVFSLVVGWGITMTAAELWIAATPGYQRRSVSGITG